MSLPSGPVPPSPCRYYGLTKVQAIEQGYDAEEGVASYDACLRGRVFAPDGMLKLVFDRDTARILGVHIIGTDACELVRADLDCFGDVFPDDVRACGDPDPG